MAFFQVLAVDLDGTLTTGGELSPHGLAAIDEARRDGLAVVLVSGRIEAELLAEFPHVADHVDAMVLENGAVIVINERTTALCAPVEKALDDALTSRGIPYRRGEVIVAVDGEHAATVVELIGALGLDCQLVRNRAALMVLPAGVTKGAGLDAVLTEMNLSPHNTVAVGDAENDLSLFATAEIGVAVADALRSVRRHADVVLEQPDGAGVVELLTGPYLSSARRWCPQRRWIDIGTFDDGTPAQVPGSQARILVAGPAGSGKSYLVGLMAERWVLAGYSILVVDPEGDHVELQDLNQVNVVDARHYLPEPTEVVDTLLHPRTSIVADLSALPESKKIDYVHRLRDTAEAHREERGYPHWVIYDEAHLLGRPEQAPWTRRGGYVLSSYTPESLPANEIDITDVVVELTHGDTAEDVASEPVQRATLRFGSGPARPLTVADRRTHHVRHRHKYADVALPRERRFYFHAVDGKSAAAAGTLHDFRAAVLHLDPHALEYHLERGDFSRWLANTIADNHMAARVSEWEDELLAHRAADLERIRRQLVREIEERYLGADGHD